MLCYRALELFAFWPLITTGLLCLSSVVALGLGTRWGLVRYWWVATKLALSVVLVALGPGALRPEVMEKAEQGRRFVAGKAASLAVGDLIFPPMVSPTLLLVAFVLAAMTQKTAFGYAASLLTAYLQVRQASKVCPAEAPRREQGAGAALVAPAALSLVTLFFTEEQGRAKALSIWGSLAGLGATAGVLLGGVLSDLASWRWIFLINLPVAAVALLLVPRLVAESRGPSGRRRRLDLSGAVLVTAGLSSIVFALLGKGEQAWVSGAVLVPLACGLALLGLFVAVEARAENPLVPLRFFLRSGARSASYAVFLLASGAMMAMYFSLSLYMQRVLGYSPLSAGLAYLPLCATFFVGFGAGSRLTARLGAWMVIIGGLLVAAAGLALLSGISANGSYLVDLLPGMLVAPVGAGATFVAVTITAMDGTGEGDAGLASGMLTTAQQVGSALGLAVLVSLAVARTHELHSTGATPPVAAAGGFSLSFGAASGVLAAGALLTFFAMRSRITSRCDDDRSVVETR